MGLAGGLGPAQVNYQPAPAVQGDFASNNTNRFSYLAGPGALVAGASGVNVGLFAWVEPLFLDPNGNGSIVNNFGSGPVSGFIAREQQGLNTVYLSDASMFIPQGFGVTVFDSGDFWALNSGGNQALPGMKAYANFLTGAVTFNYPNTPVTASATLSTVTAGTAAAFTGVINGNVLTTSGVVTNTIYPGAVVTGSGVAANTSIIGQLSGTTGGAGTYAVSPPEQTVASTALTVTPYILTTTGGTVTGTIVIGSVINSAGGTVTATPPAAIIGAGVTAQYATGVWVVSSLGATVTSGTVVLESNVETKWFARSAGLANEIVKISSTPLG